MRIDMTFVCIPSISILDMPSIPSDPRSSPSTGRSWLDPEGNLRRCTRLANIFVMRMLYMCPGCVFCLQHCVIIKHLARETFTLFLRKQMYSLQLSLWYAWSRGVHFLVEQPISSALALLHAITLTGLVRGDNNFPMVYVIFNISDS